MKSPEAKPAEDRTSKLCSPNLRPFGIAAILKDLEGKKMARVSAAHKSAGEKDELFQILSFS